MNTFVPVLFYDVVDDKYVQEEKELLKEKLPDIVVWKDIPYCKEVHEREFQRWKNHLNSAKLKICSMKSCQCNMN